MSSSTHTLLDTGLWGIDIAWELYATSVLPPIELCSAVMCVAIKDDQIILARSGRGWGMLGGHIEDNETFEQALHRESLEEGGFLIDTYSLFAIRKITSSKPIEHPDKGKTYPFPVSYIPYYIATTKQQLLPHSGEEILESGRFTIDEIRRLETPDQPTIEAGWMAYVNGREEYTPTVL